MKFFTLCSVALFAASTLHAEESLVITKDNAKWGTIGERVEWFYMEAAPEIPQGGENQVWDYSNVQHNGYYYFYDCGEASNAAIPEATYTQTGTFGLNQVNIDGFVYMHVTETGEHIIANEYKETTVDLGLGTLYIPDQVHRIGNENTRLQLPASYQSNWSSEIAVDIDMELTVPSAGLQDAPFMFRQSSLSSDTVIGSGTIKLPDNQEFQVLLAKRKIVVLDSFFLGGQPAPDQLLAAFGVAQGTLSEKVEYRFFAPGVYDYLVRIIDDGQGTEGSYRRSSTTDVEPIADAQTPVHVYPNPVQGNNATTVQFEKTSPAAWSIEIANTLGQTVHTIGVQHATGTVRSTFAMPASLSAGTYFYTIRDERGHRVYDGTIIRTR